jgi:hypothetical protein
MKRPLASAFRILGLLVIPLLLAACNQALVMSVLAPPQDKSVAEYYIGLFIAGNLGTIERDLDPAMDAGDTNAKLTEAFKLVPQVPPISTKLVGMKVLTFNGEYTTSFSYEYQYPGKWLIISVATRGKGADFHITALTVQEITAPLEQINRFTLSGKSGVQYLVLAAIPIVALITLMALVLCIREKGIKLKWLWIIFILLGIGAFGVNWKNGDTGLQIASMQLFSASAIAAPYGPWILRISLPLGALIYLIRRLTKRSALKTAT